LTERARNGRGACRKGLRMPRKTRHWRRVERGLIAFLETGAPAASAA